MDRLLEDYIKDTQESLDAIRSIQGKDIDPSLILYLQKIFGEKSNALFHKLARESKK